MSGWQPSSPMDETTLIYKQGDDTMNGKLTTQGLAVQNGQDDPLYIEPLVASPDQARLIVKEDGKIGIGTEDPQADLHIKDFNSQASIILESQVGNPSIIFIGDEGSITSPSGEIYFDNTEGRMVLKSKGKEFIGFDGTEFNMQGDDDEKEIKIRVGNDDVGGAAIQVEKSGIEKIAVRHDAATDSGHIETVESVPLFITAKQGSPESSIVFRTSTSDDDIGDIIENGGGDVAIDSSGLLVANKGINIKDNFSLVLPAITISDTELETLTDGSDADALHAHKNVVQLATMPYKLFIKMKDMIEPVGKVVRIQWDYTSSTMGENYFVMQPKFTGDLYYSFKKRVIDVSMYKVESYNWLNWEFKVKFDQYSTPTYNDNYLSFLLNNIIDKDTITLVLDYQVTANSLGSGTHTIQYSFDIKDLSAGSFLNNVLAVSLDKNNPDDNGVEFTNGRSWVSRTKPSGFTEIS